MDFLDKWQPTWTKSGGLVCHVWWHNALQFVELGDFESALSIWDNQMKTFGRDRFELSDKTSLLMRLELEGQPKGVDLKDRWREVGKAYQESSDENGSTMFYEFHYLLSILYGEADQKVVNKLFEVAEEVAKGDHFMGHKYKTLGLNTLNGIREFANGNYEECVRLMYPIRNKMVKLLGGSSAQLSVLRDILTRACIRGGPKLRETALQLLDEQVAQSGCNAMDNKMTRMRNDLIAH